MLKRFLGMSTLLAASLLGATTTSTALADTKIAVIDTQRVFMETEEGLRAQATLKKIFDSRQRELDKKQEDLQKERESIEKQRDVLSKEALQRRIEAWQREMMQLQSTYVDYNRELQKKQSELTQPIAQKAMGVVRRLATSEGYDLVVDKQAVPYVRSDLDLTDKVITLCNSSSSAPAETNKKKDAPKAAPKP